MLSTNSSDKAIIQKKSFLYLVAAFIVSTLVGGVLGVLIWLEWFEKYLLP